MATKNRVTLEELRRQIGDDGVDRLLLAAYKPSEMMQMTRRSTLDLRDIEKRLEERVGSNKIIAELRAVLSGGVEMTKLRLIPIRRDSLERATTLVQAPFKPPFTPGQMQSCLPPLRRYFLENPKQATHFVKWSTDLLKRMDEAAESDGVVCSVCHETKAPDEFQRGAGERDADRVCLDCQHKRQSAALAEARKRIRRGEKVAS